MRQRNEVEVDRERARQGRPQTIMMGDQPRPNQPFQELELIEVPLSQIGERYGHLRIIHPVAEAAMERSLQTYGQLSPVVLCPVTEHRYELLDGFKRLRGSRKLLKPSLAAKVLNGGVHASKAALLHMNWVGRSVSAMEEALVVHSLCREDGLSQVEIATLLGRHNSWVCRRLSLIERLCDDVCESIKLGLISVSIGREVAKLPRGNQEAALSSIQKHRLTCRETQRLISSLLSRPGWEHDAILQSPWELLKDGAPRSSVKDPRFSQAASILNQTLMAMEQHCLAVRDKVSANMLSCLSQGDVLALAPAMGSAIRSAEQTVERLHLVLSGDESQPPEKEGGASPAGRVIHGALHP